MASHFQRSSSELSAIKALHVVVEQAKKPVAGLVDRMTVCSALAVGVGCTQVTASWIEG